MILSLSLSDLVGGFQFWDFRHGLLAPNASLLLAGLALDTLLGDPQVRFHPIRLLGNSLSGYEALLRRVGLNGYTGGCALFILLCLTWVVLPSLAIVGLSAWNSTAAAIAHALVVYILFALRDLVDHINVVRRAANSGDLAGARAAIELLVGRDTNRMDIPACRRAAIESLSENFVDGFLSPLFWYVLGGLPGLLLFKVVSTMDSMVGYKTPRYLQFGWCGARVDDVMNYIPARLAWLLLGLCALLFPNLSARKGWRIGLRLHGLIPGPNPGWSEATMAGILEKRLIGPIWKQNTMVTDIWIGDPKDPEAGADSDLRSALNVVYVSSFVAAALAAAACSRSLTRFL